MAVGGIDAPAGEQERFATQKGFLSSWNEKAQILLK